MPVFIDYLKQNLDGFRIIVDSRAAARPASPPSKISVEASGSSGTPALDLARASREPSPVTAYISRGGTIFVLSIHGSGKLVYEGAKGAPSALQRRAISLLEDALSIARGETPSKRKSSELDSENVGDDSPSEPGSSILSDSDGVSGDSPGDARVELED